MSLAWNVRIAGGGRRAPWRERRPPAPGFCRKPQTAFWGGYTGYFTDPDGHIWEVAHNPGFPLSDDGRLTLAD